MGEKGWKVPELSYGGGRRGVVVRNALERRELRGFV
jgi:hypothetical protein